MTSLAALEWNVLTWFQARHTPQLNAVIVNLTDLGYRYVVALVLLAAAAVFVFRRQARTALYLLLAGVLASILTDGIKWLVGRPRPPLPAVAETSFLFPVLNALPSWWPSYSFPSAHAFVSSAGYVTLALVIARRQRRRWQCVLVVGGGLALTAVIGLTRLYLGVHYPSDVLAGWTLGLSVALGCNWLARGGAEPRGLLAGGARSNSSS
jgi:undecaprenyl-diphosphatase